MKCQKRTLEILNKPVHVNVLSRAKILLAIVTKAEEALRWVTKPVIRFRHELFTFLSQGRETSYAAAALNNAIIKNMSGFGIGAMRNDTSVVLREFHLSGREAARENLRRIAWCHRGK